MLTALSGLCMNMRNCSKSSIKLTSGLTDTVTRYSSVVLRLIRRYFPVILPLKRRHSPRYSAADTSVLPLSFCG
jgi:hypothetical protein